MNELITTHIKNDAHSKAKSPSPDIRVFRNAIKLLEHLDASDISRCTKPFSICPDDEPNAHYHVYYKGELIFTIIRTTSKLSFNSRFLLTIRTEALFNKLYYAPGAPGYQSKKVVVSQIIKHMNELITTHIKNDVHSKAKSPSPDIQVLRNAIKLLEHLDASDISRCSSLFSICPVNEPNAHYYVYYKGELIFTIIRTAIKLSFNTRFLVTIRTEALFTELYYAPGAPGYQSAESEFEEYRKQ
ncbi:hypothetical protein [Endozoicomonas sp. ISHI1]|uniref:hypothetical protein n=1 Tax=Endozoicomonas sp. ISHI1 TaxID=2825882 RepID=UPI002149757A|nr:hypothetical protein [Endozoicomonas sp. ISHI1]